MPYAAWACCVAYVFLKEDHTKEVQGCDSVIVIEHVDDILSAISTNVITCINQVSHSGFSMSRVLHRTWIFSQVSSNRPSPIPGSSIVSSLVLSSKACATTSAPWSRNLQPESRQEQVSRGIQRHVHATVCEDASSFTRAQIFSDVPSSLIPPLTLFARKTSVSF